MATHCSILAWRSPWTEEPGRLQSGVAKSRTRLSDSAGRLAAGLSRHTAPSAPPHARLHVEGGPRQMPLCPGSPTLTATCWQQGSLSVNAPFHMHTEFSP